VLCVIALQYVAQDALPLAKRRVAQVIPQLRAPAAQGWSLLARQVAVQLRQHHQGEHLQGDLSRLDQAFEFLDIVVEYGQGFFVGMGNGKGILLADQPDEVSIHSAGSSVRGQGGCPVLPQMPSRCKLCGWMPAAGKGQYTSTAKPRRVNGVLRNAASPIIASLVSQRQIFAAPR